MREKLIMARTNHEMAIERIDKALKALEDNPELEKMWDAWQAMMSVGQMIGY